MDSGINNQKYLRLRPENMESVRVRRFAFMRLTYFLIFLLVGKGSYEEKTVEVKSNAITSIRDGEQVLTQHRAKRELFSTEINYLLVAKHNELRRLEGASDMEILTWNGYLASMAEDWARACRWGHGQPGRPEGELPFDHIGQNLFAYNGTFNALAAIQAFYDEKQFYDYGTGACSKEPCGHYTQVAWSTSREMGCAYAFCQNMFNVDMINAHYFVCNYGPAGNVEGVKPFKKGQACTQCSSGSFWCDNGLCRSDCTVQDTTCECAADCKNCAATISSNCSCSCSPGWTGIDCSERCQDKNPLCGAIPGWPVSWCYKDMVRSDCPAMCSLCTPSTERYADPCKTTTDSNVKRNGARSISAEFKHFLITASLFCLLK